jgi:hypothetical protein
LPSTTIVGSDAAPARPSARAESIIAQSVRIPTGFMPLRDERICGRMNSSGPHSAFGQTAEA